MATKKSREICIIGLGRFGSAIADQLLKDKKILVVAHAGVIQALISYYLFGNLDGYLKFRIDNGSMTKMHIMEDGYTYFEYINLTQ